MKSEYFECRCFADEHGIRFTYDDDPNDPEIYLHVFLNDWLPWYIRIYRSVKYIFGYKCKYGHWDCWLLNPRDAERLNKFTQKMMNRKVKQ